MKEFLTELFTNEGFEKAVFSNKRKKSLECRKVMMRPVLVKGQKLIQVERTFEKKVTHQNIRFEDAPAFAMQIVSDEFKQINALTAEEEIQVLCNKVEKPMITRTPKDKLPDITLDNNRKKNYIIPDGQPCDFLIRLGVMDEDGKVFQRAYSKFRQINRYLEIVEDCYPYLCTNSLNKDTEEKYSNSKSAEKGEEQAEKDKGKQSEEQTEKEAEKQSEKQSEKPLKIIDFGCGKAYLTFALYHYLKKIKGRNVEIIGLDLKKDVIDFCGTVAKDLGYDGLKFLMGDIADYTNDNADMVVTLHACDTATDYALINAVSWNTRVILSVPCCQHELFKQIKNDIHAPMLRHGILKDRLTEYLTDGLRALKLEAKGYDVAMIEFTSLEHTARNIMIKAVKSRPNKGRMDKAQTEYEALRDFYHVKPTIDKL